MEWGDPERDPKSLCVGGTAGYGQSGWYTRQHLMIFALFNKIKYCVMLDILKSSFWGQLNGPVSKGTCHQA